MIAAERETSIAYTDADEYVLIYTCRRQDITALKKKLDKGVVLHSEGAHQDGTPWAEFRIPLNRFSLAKCLKTTLALTPEERVARAERVTAARNRTSDEASAA